MEDRADRNRERNIGLGVLNSSPSVESSSSWSSLDLNRNDRSWNSLSRFQRLQRERREQREQREQQQQQQGQQPAQQLQQLQQLQPQPQNNVEDLIQHPRHLLRESIYRPNEINNDPIRENADANADANQFRYFFFFNFFFFCKKHTFFLVLK